MTRRTSREDDCADAPVQARYGNYSTCSGVLWKKRHLNAYFMEKTAPKIMFYGNLLYFMEILCHFMEICCTLWKFCVILWKFVVTYGNFVSQGSAKRGVFFRPFGVGRGRSGSVGVGRGTGTFSGPIRAPESDRSELWKLCSTFMENFHSQTCTGSIMEICSTLWKKSVNKP